MSQVYRKYGDFEYTIDLNYESIKIDLAQGGSTRVDWWLDTVDSIDIIHQFIPLYQWNNNEIFQSKHTLLKILEVLSQTPDGQRLEQFLHSWNVPSQFFHVCHGIFNILRDKEVRPKLTPYENLELLSANLELLSCIDQVQREGLQSNSIPEYLSRISLVSRQKELAGENLNVVDLFILSSGFQLVLAQIRFLDYQGAKSILEFTDFLETNYDLELEKPIPYPETKESLDYLSAFLVATPQAKKFPFMHDPGPQFWHHVHSALRRKLR